MKIKIQALSANIENNALLLGVEDNISLSKIGAKEQMLVDSDLFSFVYILEDEGEYVYLVIHEDLWPTLKESLKKSLPTYLYNKNGQLSLPMFHEELSYLIENIKGNSNYGEEMVEKVENTF